MTKPLLKSVVGISVTRKPGNVETPPATGMKDFVLKVTNYRFKYDALYDHMQRNLVDLSFQYS